MPKSAQSTAIRRDLDEVALTTCFMSAVFSLAEQALDALFTSDEVQPSQPPALPPEYTQPAATPGTPLPDSIARLTSLAKHGNINPFTAILRKIMNHTSLDTFDPNNHVLELLSNIKENNADTVVALYTLNNMLSKCGIAMILLTSQITIKIENIISTLDMKNIQMLETDPIASNMNDIIKERKAALVQKKQDEQLDDTYDFVTHDDATITGDGAPHAHND